MKPTLADDIAYAISCVQDYKDTIDIDGDDSWKTHDEINARIHRLFQFYYQLIGYDPYEKKE